MRACVLLATLAAGSGWRLKVDRTIDASKSIVRTVTLVSAENDGDATDELLWAVPESNMTSIAKLKLSQKTDGTGKDGKPLYAEIPTTEARREGGVVYFNAKLRAAVPKGETVEIRSRMSQGGALRPLPPQVRQAETMSVDYNHNVYFLSPYPCVLQKTVFQMGSPKVHSYTEEPAPVKKEGKALTFGPYRDVAPLSAAPLRVHYENNAPFIKAASVRRVMEVSQWGNLAVEEWYEIENVGAALKGTFSRVDYEKMGSKAPAAFANLDAELPAGAEDIYFRDDIGNISTSEIRAPQKGKKVVRFKQRFPLFGGWKTRFYYGYNQPLAQVMTTNGETHRLRVPYVTAVDHMFINDFTVEVVLPEGVPAPSVTIAGRPVTDFEVGVRKSYLDTQGRTLVTIRDTMLDARERTEMLEVTFAAAPLLWEPCLIMGACMAVLCTIIAFGRLAG